MDIISRAGWGARAPKSVSYVDRDQRTGFVVHYSGASKTQTVRSIQDYHMDHNGWADIGYNFLVNQAGTLFEGRGWDILGAHVQGHNTANIGVCFIGEDGDITDEAKRAIRWLADAANSRFGRALTHYGHRDLMSTDCPGDMLWNWVHSGMPVTGTDPTPGPNAPAWPGRYFKYVWGWTSSQRVQGTDVRTWQQRMHDRGWSIAVDGDYGPGSRDVCMSFQREKGLGVDGIVGPITWQAAWTAPVT